MKKLILMSLIVPMFFIVSCVTTGVTPPCTLYEQYEATPENSLIAAKISDPCEANRIITMVAKLPAIEFGKDYIDEFNVWADDLRALLPFSCTYKDIQDDIIFNVARLNIKAGMTLFIISDGILVFDNEQLIFPKDVELLIALIDNLKREVNSLRIML